jgi:hypothetical protein
MNAEDILFTAYLISTAALIIFIYRYSKRPRTYITDYMSGVRFVKGKYVDVVGPGSYKPFTRRSHIEVVDMRPVPFLLERISYRNAFGNESVVSIGAWLSVNDPYLAAASLKRQVDDSLPIVRERLSNTVSRTVADLGPEFRTQAAEGIQTAVNEELRRLGMKISSVEITEFFSRSALPQRTVRGLN